MSSLPHQPTNFASSEPPTVSPVSTASTMLPQDDATLHSATTTRASSPISLETPQAAKTKPKRIGTSSETLETELPFRTTLYIVIALMVNQFLATSDATIVSTSLPTIVAELHGTQNEYAWVPVAYLLTQTAFQPLYGKLADVFGRRPVIYASTIIFLIGSALCGAAQSMRFLILSRALSGIGGGGIVNSVWVLTTDIVPPGTHAKWSQALSVTWSASAVAGPILGGLFTGKVSWRWAFFINIPIGLAALAVAGYFLQQIQLVRKFPDGSVDTRTRREVFRQAYRTFDYIGLTLLMGGTSVLVIGFSLAGYNSWTSPRTLGLLISGAIALILSGVYESYLSTTEYAHEALIPSGIFKQLTVVNTLAISILHNFAFTAGTYYIPLYYQALHGTSPLVAGMQVLPFSLGAALVTIPTAWLISWRKGSQWIDMTLKLAMVTGLTLSVIGYGLMITLNERSGIVIQEVYPLIAGVGIGILFHTPFQVVTNSLPRRDLAQATGAFFLVRFIGTTTGLSVAGAVFDSNWVARKPQAYLSLSENPLHIDLRSLVHIEPIELRQQVLKAISASVSCVWIACTPCLGVALLISLFLRVRHHESHSKQSTSCSASDAEKGIEEKEITLASCSTSTTGNDEKPTLSIDDAKAIRISTDGGSIRVSLDAKSLRMSVDGKRKRMSTDEEKTRRRSLDTTKRTSLSLKEEDEEDAKSTVSGGTSTTLQDGTLSSQSPQAHMVVLPNNNSHISLDSTPGSNTLRIPDA